MGISPAKYVAYIYTEISLYIFINISTDFTKDISTDFSAYISTVLIGIPTITNFSTDISRLSFAPHFGRELYKTYTRYIPVDLRMTCVYDIRIWRIHAMHGVFIIEQSLPCLEHCDVCSNSGFLKLAVRYTYTHAHTHLRMHTRTHTCMHTYARTHTHTQTHTHIYTS